MNDGMHGTSSVRACPSLGFRYAGEEQDTPVVTEADRTIRDFSQRMSVPVQITIPDTVAKIGECGSSGRHADPAGRLRMECNAAVRLPSEDTGHEAELS